MIPLIFRRIALAHELLTQDRPPGSGTDVPASGRTAPREQEAPAVVDSMDGCLPTHDPA